MEAYSPGMHTKVKAFYDTRTIRSKAVQPGRGYRIDEITKKDKFIDKYMGKVYVNNSEILSMGL